MNTIRRDKASLKGWANVWSQEKRLRPNSESIAMLKDHMMKSTLTDLRLIREWGQQRSSTAISRMVRRLAASCPKDSQTTVPSLLQRQQQSHCHLTIIGTWILYSTMSLSTLAQCLACRQLKANILTTLSFARSWISSGHWATKALVSASAGCQAIVA